MVLLDTGYTSATHNGLGAALLDTASGGAFDEELELVGADLEEVTGLKGDGGRHANALVTGADGRASIVKDILGSLAGDGGMERGDVVVTEEGNLGAFIASEVGLSGVDWPLFAFIAANDEAHPGLAGGLFEPGGEESNSETHEGPHEGATCESRFSASRDDLTDSGAEGIEEKTSDAATEKTAECSGDDDSGSELSDPNSGSEKHSDHGECEGARNDGKGTQSPSGTEKGIGKGSADLVAEDSADSAEDSSEGNTEEDVAATAFHVALVETGGQSGEKHGDDDHAKFGGGPVGTCEFFGEHGLGYEPADESGDGAQNGASEHFSHDLLFFVSERNGSELNGISRNQDGGSGYLGSVDIGSVR